MAGVSDGGMWSCRNAGGVAIYKEGVREPTGAICMKDQRACWEEFKPNKRIKVSVT